jgi:maleylacetate reductase
MTTSRQFSYESLPGRVVFGSGSRLSLPAELDALGATRILLVASAADLALADEITDILGDRVAGRFSQVIQHVPAHLADAAVNQARQLSADTVVTAGGGSATGLGKAIRLQLDVRFLAVPTTYAGSEMTSIWGMSDGDEKRVGTDRRVKPDTVIYDPELTRSLPPSIAGPSGMNALAHAVEALYAPGASPVISLIATEATRVLAAALPALVKAPADLSIRTDALYGAYLAATALASAGTALHHKTCHVLGGLFALDHGALNAVVLPHSLAYTAPAIPEVLDQLAPALGAGSAAEVPRCLWELARTLNAPGSLREIGMPSGDLDHAASLIVAAAAANPRPPEHIAIVAMLKDACTGRMPSLAATARAYAPSVNASPLHTVSVRPARTT